MSDDRYDMEIGPVETVSVLAGGFSFKGLNPNALPGMTIGVNDAGLIAGTQMIVSMDRIWTEKRWDRLVQRHREAWIRTSALVRIEYEGRPAFINRPHWLRPFACNHKTSEFSETDDILNGQNSGQCAFNLAYLIQPKTIYLFGFDMCRSKTGEAYWHPPYEWSKPTGNTSGGKYKAWASRFSAARKACERKGIKVINCSLYSAIPDFPKIDPREVLTP